ncbi:MAG: hypothetical protein JWO95_2136 [Verrucomicrobiales bacterium]|nr:hypothetical protein [Verrucomicrobiales bacterium]
MLYVSFLHLRSGRIDVVWWNPVSWRRMASELRQHKALADCFHNLALFSVQDFERFDEERFWQDIERLGRRHGHELVERYQRIFDEYVAGRAVYVC